MDIMDKLVIGSHGFVYVYHSGLSLTYMTMMGMTTEAYTKAKSHYNVSCFCKTHVDFKGNMSDLEEEFAMDKADRCISKTIKKEDSIKCLQVFHEYVMPRLNLYLHKKYTFILDEDNLTKALLVNQSATPLNLPPVTLNEKDLEGIIAFEEDILTNKFIRLLTKEISLRKQLDLQYNYTSSNFIIVEVYESKSHGSLIATSWLDLIIKRDTLGEVICNELKKPTGYQMNFEGPLLYLG